MSEFVRVLRKGDKKSSLVNLACVSCIHPSIDDTATFILHDDTIVETTALFTEVAESRLVVLDFAYGGRAMTHRRV